MFRKMINPSALLFLIFFWGCSSAPLLLQEPEITDITVSMTDISFEQVSLTVSVVIYNPNPVSLDLSRYSYAFSLEGNPLISGENAEGLNLSAGGASVVEIPITMVYKDLYETFEQLQGADEAAYRMDAEFSFSLPVLGDVVLETFKEGSVPLVKIPRFRFVSLHVKDLGMMGADIEVLMETENPNPFVLKQNHFEGDLIVNGERWATLSLPESLEIAPGEKGSFRFRIRLEFLSMGRTVRDLLSGEKRLFYSFPGMVVLDGDLELLDRELLDLSLEGEILLDKPDNTTEGQHSSEKIEDSIEDNLLHLFGRYSGP